MLLKTMASGKVWPGAHPDRAPRTPPAVSRYRGERSSMRRNSGRAEPRAAGIVGVGDLVSGEGV
ncbi:MAG TPA: hypothetical protein VIU29_06290, partial [Candidatus Deferrimicrobiaceae bacterium]